MKKLSILGLLVASAFASYSDNCTMCHNGGYQSDLNNYTQKEIITKLHYFQKNDVSPMSEMVKNMTDKEIKEIAKKYGKQ